jgi:lysophosphatidylcholine acyltransferase / lyso-PAF acetyltransferase
MSKELDHGHRDVRHRDGPEESTCSANGAAANGRAQVTDEERDAAFIARHGRLRRPVGHPAFDPFRREQDGPLTVLDYVKGVVGVVLIPVRLLLAAALMVIPYIFVVLAGPRGSSDDLLHDPELNIPAWRRQICTFASKFLGRGLLVVLGFWRVNGRDDPRYDHEEAQRATIVSNHVSLADPCLLAYLYAPSFVAKQAVSYIPFVGRVGAAQHAFYIDRMAATGPSTTEIIARRQRLIADKKTNLPPVAVFPEGTTTSGLYMLRLRTGAFVAGTPVAPIILRYPYERFSPSYESIKTLPYLYRMLSQFWNNVEYLRLPVYYPSEAEKNDPRLYADNVMKLMVERSDFLPGTSKFKVSDSCYTDKIEFHSIIRNRMLGKNIKLA